MSKLYLYAIFHANLNFSCVPEEFYPQVLRNCYWPLLRMIEDQDAPLGLELNAETPEEIAVSIMAEIIARRNSGTGDAMKWMGSLDAADEASLAKKE